MYTAGGWRGNAPDFIQIRTLDRILANLTEVFRCFFKYFRVYSEIIWLGYDPLHPNRFRVVIIQSFYHSTPNKLVKTLTAIYNNPQNATNYVHECWNCSLRKQFVLYRIKKKSEFISILTKTLQIQMPRSSYNIEITLFLRYFYIVWTSWHLNL
jgi:hypothetical protein